MSAPEDGWPSLPDWVTVGPDVDLDSPDPAAVEGQRRRRCIAETKEGKRCGAPALGTHLICAAHGRLMDSRAGGLARAEKAREAAEAAEARATLARSGTRAVIAAALAEKHSELRQALHVLATSAAAGDVKSAQALIPWLNQGLGMPTERVETSTGSEAADLQALSTAELEQLVASRRAERLRAAPDPPAEVA